MPPPDPHTLASWLVALLALYALGQDRVAHETTALALLIGLLLGLQLFPYDGEHGAIRAGDVFARLGHEALVTIAALLIMAKALETTGALTPLFAALGRLWARRPGVAGVATLALAALLSAFINNTPVVVMLMPLLVGVALRAGIAPSRLLMPMGFATMVGGMATVIGASTNLLVIGLAADLGLAPVGLFDFVLPVSVAAAVALLYLWRIAPRLLPDRNPPLTDTSPRVFNAVLRIDEHSAAAGRTLPEVLALTENRMRIDRVQRGHNLFVAKLPSLRIQPGDRLHVRDLPERLKTWEQRLGATLAPDQPTAETGDAVQQLAEIVVVRGALLHRNTLADSRFASRFGVLPLAIHRSRAAPGEEPPGDIAEVELRAGDVLLVQGSRESIEALKRSNVALVLDGTTELAHTHRAPRAVAVGLLTLAAIATGVLPVSVCALLGVGLMLLTHCLSWRDIVTALNTRLILVIAAALAVSLMLVQTGGATYLAALLASAAAGWPVPLVLAAFMAALILLTNAAANTLVAAIAVPVAVPLAEGVGAPPLAFVLAALFAASMSFMRPAGYQTNLLLLTTGGYRPVDFLRVGAPLAVLMWLTLSLTLSWFFGL